MAGDRPRQHAYENYLIYRVKQKSNPPSFQNFKEPLRIYWWNFAFSRFARWARKASEIYWQASKETAG